MQSNDYKYIMDNLSHVQIGARYSYAELEDNEDLSYKFRCIIKRFLEKEVDPQTTLESHLYYMEPEDESTRIYQQIKARIRVYVGTVKVNKSGREETVFKERLYTPQELAAIPVSDKKRDNFKIAELQLSRVGLMTYAM